MNLLSGDTKNSFFKYERCKTLEQPHKQDLVATPIDQVDLLDAVD